MTWLRALNKCVVHLHLHLHLHDATITHGNMLSIPEFFMLSNAGFEPSYSSGSSVLHGSRNYGFETHEIKLEPDEKNNSAEVRAGDFLDAITFKTSTGRIFGQYGGNGGTLSTFILPARNAFLAYMEGVVEVYEGMTAVRRLKLTWGYY